MPRLNKLTIIEETPMTLELRYSEFSGRLGECSLKIRFSGASSIEITLLPETFIRLATLSSFPILKTFPFTGETCRGTIKRKEAIKEVRRLMEIINPKGVDHG